MFDDKRPHSLDSFLARVASTYAHDAPPPDFEYVKAAHSFFVDRIKSYADSEIVEGAIKEAA